MAVRHLKPTSAGRRFQTISDFAEITTDKPEKSLLEPLPKKAGRNNNGRITTRHQGGGHKRQYRRMGKDNGYAVLRMPSSELRRVLLTCRATVGEVGNADHSNIVVGKAGRSRWAGIRPTVRGTVMNPVDHPHGGGEGKNHTSGRPSVTPWGKPTKGYKTRDPKKASNRLIIRRRKSK